MRDLRLLDAYRLRGQPVIELWGWEGDETCGAFEISSPIDGGVLRIVVSSEGGWDHVSVSRKNRCPNYPEMDFIKRIFFEDHETAMQLHVPAADHVNMHEFCLHLWRPQYTEIPRPPAIMVGIGQTPVRSLIEAKSLLKEAGL